jgi:uncharacterized protein (DUF302 family)
MVHLNSSHSVDETLSRLEAAVKAKGIRIHALIDHSGDAIAAGIEMRPTKLLIFGAAKAGTPVMLAAPTAAIDLPLKALVWEDGDGHVWLSYNGPEYLQRRHGFPEELMKNLAAIKVLAEEAVS